MNPSLIPQFTERWRRYFNDAELPLAFEYADDARGAKPEAPFAGHRCFVAQLIAARNGRTLCLRAASVACRGGGYYLGFRERMFPHFDEFIAHDARGEGERYRRTPEQVRASIDEMPPLPLADKFLLVKRWDMLSAEDRPDGVIFFARPDVLSGLFMLACYDSDRSDAVIAPFGAGCSTIIYRTYREQHDGTGRAILGMFDPSARKCIKGDLLTFAVPFDTFERMAGHMEESFLRTPSWEIIRRRIK